MADESLDAAPEQAVMHDEQIRVGGDRASDSAERRVDGSRGLSYWISVRDLESVQGRRIVWNAGRAEDPIEMLGDRTGADAIRPIRQGAPTRAASARSRSPRSR